MAAFLTGAWIDVFDQSTYGLPIQYGGEGTVTMTFDDAGESDAVPYPAITRSVVDGFGSTDSSWLAVDQDHRTLYEVYSVHVGDPTKAFSGAKWDLRSNNLRTDTWTSSSESGLPMATSIVRYGEAQGAMPKHALVAAISWPAIKNAYVWPARHVATITGSSAVGIPLGSRIRLKSSYSIPGGLSNTTTHILQCLKTYGAFISDRSGDKATPTLTGTLSLYLEPDGNLFIPKAELPNLTGMASALEFVDESGVQISANSGACTQP